MPRVISFIVLLAIVLLVGAIFFQVMAQFIVPMFLACVLLVVFQPLHRWILHYLPKYPRLAALATTVAILLVVLLPLVWLGWKAFVEMHDMFAPGSSVIVVEGNDPSSTGVTADAKSSTGSEKRLALQEKLRRAGSELREKLKELTGFQITDDTVSGFLDSAQAFLTNKAITGLQTAIRILVGLAIMVIALYYFLADGPAMIETVLDLSPLDSKYEQELLERFGDVSRAVVVATLLSAVVQGTLAGIGYAFALPHEAPVFLLTALTMVTALVPFVGAVATWICVAGWVYLYGEHVVNGQVVQGDPTKAIILAIYCTLVVSSIDNVIKPFILHGQSKLHPLLALLSILGGVQVLGPVGILVGPMLVSFLQALLNMLRKELDSFGGVAVDGVAPLAVPAEITARTPSTEDSATHPASSTADKPAAKSLPALNSNYGGGRRGKRKK